MRIKIEKPNIFLSGTGACSLRDGIIFIGIHQFLPRVSISEDGGLILVATHTKEEIITKP
jgi:hypothetical protein